MFSPRTVVSAVVGILVFAPAGVGLEQLDREERIQAGTPLVEEMIADERPPPDERVPLAEFPMRTQFPSRVFLPGLPEVGIADPGSDLVDTDETQLVRLVYDTYSRYSEREDGERVEFVLDDFRTVYRPQFDRVVYHPDLAWMDAEWRIKAGIIHHSMNGAPQGVLYEAEWMPGLGLAEKPEFARLRGLSAREMLEIIGAHFPEWRRTVAITSYRVQVSYLGRTLTYRAAFAWQIGEEQDLRFSIVEPVVPEIHYVMGESDLPVAEHERSRLDRPFDRLTGRSTAKECEPYAWPTRYTPQEAEYNSVEHKTGRHEAVYIGQFDCKCAGSCLQTCDPGFYAKACQDYGDLSLLSLRHEAAWQAEVAGGTSEDGSSQTARCASGLGCFVKSCKADSCGGTTIKVGGGIFGLSFTTDASTILSASMSYSHLCAACSEAEPEPEPEPEPPPSTDDSCDGGLLNETESGTCCQGECTPILLDLGGGAFELSGPVPAVAFDIDADGVADALSWTRLGADEAFLALDRDGNGVIDSGAELFGAATEQPPSDAPNGFLALAVFDGTGDGGNGDGVITAADAVFERLLLWVDADRDGVSSSQELRSPADLGVEKIGLDYVLSERRDRWGNRFRWSGRAVDGDGRPVAVSDVIFVSAP